MKRSLDSIDKKYRENSKTTFYEFKYSNVQDDANKENLCPDLSEKEEFLQAKESVHTTMVESIPLIPQQCET